MKRALLLLALVACETPDARLIYEIANGATHACGSTSCAQVSIPCEAVISIRILRPNDTTAPLVTICEPLPQNRNKDLCSIAAVDLGDAPLELPKETLEVQVVIWNRDDVTDPETNELDCARYEVKFDAVGGFPIAQQPTPAIGGHAFYHPGDSEIRVALGCTDLPALNQCSAETPLEVTATVENFENLGVLVSPSEGSRLLVSVGEPTLEGAATVHRLDPMDQRSLMIRVVGVVPTWQGEVDVGFVKVACLQVLEDSAQATATLTCTNKGIPPENTTINLGGVAMPKATLDQVLGALALAQFPPNGMTIGIVVDKELGVPLAGESVTMVMPGGFPSGTIRYLSADRNSVSVGTTTTASGMFVSLDAALGTAFRVQAGVEDKVGGRVQGKVTIVVLEK